jgi:hypothetical protein
MNRFPTLLACLVPLAACTDPGFTGVPDVRTATAAEVAGCAFVTELRTRPAVYGPLAQQGIEYARNRTLAAAREDGANTVVFEPVEPGALVTEVRARAYRC